jgi:L-amino acid N-acyltransferase YncA
MRAASYRGALDSRPVPRALLIRPAQAEDAGAIGAIYDEAAASGSATFATGPHPAQERRAWLAARPERAPVWCGVLGDEVVAWSALAPLSHRSWYAGVAEYTVYVARGHQGKGIGGRMLDALIGAAPGFGYWKLVGMILPENAAGLALARRAGFRVVGTHRAHARRDGRWRDVTIVERHLEVPDGAGVGTTGGGLTES